MSGHLRIELAFLIAAVALAALSIIATLGSARAGDLTFCQVRDGDVVIAATTACDGAVDATLIEVQPAPSTTQGCDGPTVVLMERSEETGSRQVLGTACRPAAAGIG